MTLTSSALRTVGSHVVMSMSMVGTAVMAAMSWKDANREVETSLAGIGRMSGLTADGVHRLSAEVSRYGNISKSTAREIISTYASSGVIGPENIRPLVDLTRDFSRLLGVDAVDGAKELARIMQDPIRGAE